MASDVPRSSQEVAKDMSSTEKDMSSTEKDMSSAEKDMSSTEKDMEEVTDVNGSPGSTSGGGSVGDEGVGAEKRRGRCKWFNVAKGWGFITPDDGGQDIFVHQSVIVMSGFRSLGEGEEVEFECKTSDKGLEATLVTGPEGSACVGSQRRPVAKKRFRKIRCYNCGEFANHIAAKCSLGPQPKRCHHCKSADHLIADCPNRRKSQDESEESEQNNSKSKSSAEGVTKNSTDSNEKPSSATNNTNE